MKKIAISALAILISSICVQAQSNQLIPLNRQVYEPIKKLQQRGMLLSLNPTSLPYTRGEVATALSEVDPEQLSPTEMYWFDFIEEAVLSRKAEEKEPKSLYVHGMLGGGFDLNNTRREDGLRAYEQKPFFFPNGELQLYAEGGRFGGQLGLRHPLSYFYDEDGVLPYGLYYVRAEDFYLGYQGEYLSVYFGRVKNHWGPFDEASTILSTNPYPYDNINIKFGNDRLSVEGVFGELDNLGPSEDFDHFNSGRNSQVNGTRRYLALHRINWKPSRSFQLSIFKGALYSSTTSSISFKYFNPFNELFFDRTNKPNNHYNNFFIGGMMWFNKDRFTMNGQLMLDDIHITNDNERITGSITGSMHYAGLVENVDVGLETELISYQSYNTSTQISGRYLYMGKGIATQFNDYVMGSLYGEYHAHQWVKGLSFEPRFTVLLQGEQEIDQPFYQRKPDGSLPPVVLTGVVERTVRGALAINYNPIPQFWVNAELGVNDVTNKNNVTGSEDVLLTGRIVAGFRLQLDGFIHNN